MHSGTLAIILGATEWPKSKGSWPSSPAFRNSVAEFKSIIQGEDGLNIASDDILDLFDDPRGVADLDANIQEFLERKCNLSSISVAYLVIYYVGHGCFSEGDQRYCLGVRSTRVDSLNASAYRMASLAHTINRALPNARKYLIIDACYAAASAGDFIPQSDNASRMEMETMDLLVDSGTALLCAASASTVALTPVGHEFTMFSGALLESLRNGDLKRSQMLSLDDIRELTNNKIKERFRDKAVKPEIHVPDQRKGDISKIAFFPNAALRPKKSVEKIQALENMLRDFVDVRLKNIERDVRACGELSNSNAEMISVLKSENLDLREKLSNVELSKAQFIERLENISKASTRAYQPFEIAITLDGIDNADRRVLLDLERALKTGRAMLILLIGWVAVIMILSTMFPISNSTIIKIKTYMLVPNIAFTLVIGLIATLCRPFAGIFDSEILKIRSFELLVRRKYVVFGGFLLQKQDLNVSIALIAVSTIFLFVGT
jgi:hypothetical protein